MKIPLGIAGALLLIGVLTATNVVLNDHFRAPIQAPPEPNKVYEVRLLPRGEFLKHGEVAVVLMELGDMKLIRVDGSKVFEGDGFVRIQRDFDTITWRGNYSVVRPASLLDPQQVPNPTIDTTQPDDAKVQ